MLGSLEYCTPWAKIHGKQDGEVCVCVCVCVRVSDLQAANKAGETPLALAGDLGPALEAAAGQGAMEE